MNKSPRAVLVESTPLSPLQITVPGDATTPAGSRYASTYGNDYRQECAWSEKHELQLLHLMATAKPLREATKTGNKLSYRTVAMVPSETLAVFVQSVPKAEVDASDDASSYFSDDDGYFNVVTDDGRQRRLDARVGNERLRWIAQQFVTPLWSETPDVAIRGELLRERLYIYGGIEDEKLAARYVDGADATTLPPRANGGTYSDGEILAPWLTRSYVDTLMKQPWFDEDGDAILLALRLDVRGEDVNLNDASVLLNNIRGKEASVPTPLAVKAKQYQALLSAVEDDGKGGTRFKYTVYTLAQELKCSPDSVRNVVFYCELLGEIRAAIDAGQVALKLCVTGRECICYGFDEDGERALLTRDQQKQIWDALLKAFAVEAGSEAGIPDNATTRAILRKIKAEVLAGTGLEGGGKARREGRASVAASKAAAERVGVTVDTSALDDMSKPLSRIAGDDDSGGDDDAKPAKKSKKDDDGYSSKPSTKKAPQSLRAALAVKAKQMKAQLEEFNAEGRDADEDGLVLAVADAVAAVNEGADPVVAFKRFPVLLEALGLAKRSRGSAAAVTAAATKMSPWQREERVKEVVALAVEAAEAAILSDDVSKGDIAKQINDVGASDDDEILVDAAKMLDAACSDFTTKPLAPTLANHIREYLYPAE